MLEKGISILDTDCLEVGWPMVDYLTTWIQRHHKLEQLEPGVGEQMLGIFNIVLKRVGYPEWCAIDIQPDDAQSDYQKYRELFSIILKNLSLIKPIRQQFLERINSEIQNV